MDNITKSFKQTGFTNREYFQQQSPLLGNQFLEDTELLKALKRVLPLEVLNEIKPDLTQFGDRVVNDILELGRASENNPPKLLQLDAWGRRIDKIVVDESWNKLKDIGCKEGLVSIGYERKYKEFSRIYQYIKIYLFACSSAVFDCPLSMTDGGARLLELHGTDSMKKDELQHFITRDPSQFWTSGQWMTEKTGGSDVSGSETIAQELTNPSEYPKLLSTPPTHKVSGYKYFTSATTSDSSMILARDVDKDGNGGVSGSRGLSVYLIKLRTPNGELDRIRVHKLKNKFGTKAVPTAELELMGTPAVRIGPKGRGVPVIASILNITRIHNVIHSVSTMRRCIAIGRDFAHRRTVFGKLLKDNLLYLSTLAEMELEFRAGLHFLLDVSLLLGKSECCATPETDSLLRILTPLSKLYTAKQSIWVSSEGIELLGGTGYMEDSDMPRLFRDTQVTSIWEGTTNVLSMDVWRSLKNTKTIECFFKSIQDRVSNTSGVNQNLLPLFNKATKSINDSIAVIRSVIDKVMNGDMEYAESNARRFAYLLSQTYMASLLFEHAKWSNDPLDIEVCNRWCYVKLEGGKEKNQDISFVNTDEKWREIDIKLALDLDENGNPRGTGDRCNVTNKLRSRY
ncbi:hypothetical protein DICPUDRAFT_49513 [Dictyostelium purpureum]|uniref:Acyl-CoA dehydrogenase n=1 Tax=Dictyostelium purpureum TaxID=5786 RepID=F0ZTZ5_DICPU|nr:uncharacterized protein DICPUDRAFT_49513 [Dictyostelium purpureum]EGC32589.1 hypothetical protein DICPUDRAFT_49513 [Dictyostelium purpureum]|eukprot:XP_003290880.1 hypothetical protein DICPUDRAFT_49513 [Dictyostelium purpureum]